MALSVPTSAGNTANSHVTSLGMGALNVLIGDTIVIAVCFNTTTNDSPPGAQETVSSMSDVAGSTYTRRGQKLYSTVAAGADTHFYTIEIWTGAVLANQNANTVTANFSGRAYNLCAGQMVVRGVLTPATPLDSNALSIASTTDLSGSSTAPSVPTTTSEANDILIMAALSKSQSTFPGATSGWTALTARNGDGLTGSDAIGALVQYKIVSATQAAAAITASSGDPYWGALTVALTGDGPPPPPPTLSQACIVG